MPEHGLLVLGMQDQRIRTEMKNDRRDRRPARRPADEENVLVTTAGKYL
jgi:hypothetical protein